MTAVDPLGSRPGTKQPLRTFDDLAYNLGCRGHLLHGAHRLPRIERHRLNVACRVSARGRSAEARHRHAPSAELELADGLVGQMRGGGNARSEDAMRCIRPDSEKRPGILGVFGARSY